jgi:hypothetical protein
VISECNFRLPVIKVKPSVVNVRGFKIIQQAAQTRKFISYYINLTSHFMIFIITCLLSFLCFLQNSKQNFKHCLHFPNTTHLLRVASGILNYPHKIQKEICRRHVLLHGTLGTLLKPRLFQNSTVNDAASSAFTKLVPIVAGAAQSI